MFFCNRKRTAISTIDLASRISTALGSRVSRPLPVTAHKGGTFLGGWTKKKSSRCLPQRSLKKKLPKKGTAVCCTSSAVRARPACELDVACAATLMHATTVLPVVGDVTSKRRHRHRDRWAEVPLPVAEEETKKPRLEAPRQARRAPRSPPASSRRVCFLSCCDACRAA